MGAIHPIHGPDTRCQATKPICPKTRKDAWKESRKLFSRRRVLGDGLSALRHGVLGKLTREDQADAVTGVRRHRQMRGAGWLTRSGFPGRRWSTSCCTPPAWRPRSRHARKCLQRVRNNFGSDEVRETNRWRRSWGSTWHGSRYQCRGGPASGLGTESATRTFAVYDRINKPL